MSDDDFIVITSKLKALFSDFKLCRVNTEGESIPLKMFCPKCKELLEKLEVDYISRKNDYVKLCCPFCEKFIILAEYFKEQEY